MYSLLNNAFPAGANLEIDLPISPTLIVVSSITFTLLVTSDLSVNRSHVLDLKEIIRDTTDNTKEDARTM